jgi:hypothetical protein
MLLGDPSHPQRFPCGLDGAEQPRRPFRLAPRQRHPSQPSHGAKDRPRLLDGPRQGDALRKAASSAWKVTLCQCGVAALVEHQRDEPNRPDPPETCERMFQISLSRRATIDTIVPTLLLHASAQGGYALGQALNPIGGHIMR